MTAHAPSGTVPTADSALNVTGLQVIGNKTDTEAGDSLAARTMVPLADSANNTYSSDVIGSKTDTVAGNSLVALAKQVVASAGSGLGAAVAVIDGYHDVPGADAVTNAQMRDVIGNKTDTEAGTSLVARSLVPIADAAADVTTSDVVGAKADTVAGTSLVALNRQELAAIAVIDGYHDVPAQNAADNAQARDVLGNKTDTNAGDSLYSRSIIITDDIATAQADLDTLTGDRLTGAHSSYPTSADAAPGFAPVAVLAGAANTYGAWIEIAAAGPGVPFRITGMSVWPDTADNHEVQIGYGAALAEVEIARHTFTVPAGQVDFQIEVPVNDLTQFLAGVRLVARSRSTTGATSPLVKIHTQVV